MIPGREKAEPSFMNLVRECRLGEEESTQEKLPVSDRVLFFLFAIAGAVALVYGCASRVFWHHRALCFQSGWGSRLDAIIGCSRPARLRLPTGRTMSFP